MEKPKLQDLKRGMIFFDKAHAGNQNEGPYILLIQSDPAKNNSFIVDIIDFKHKVYFRNYWKTREWESANIVTPSQEEQKTIMTTLFEIGYNR